MDDTWKVKGDFLNRWQKLCFKYDAGSPSERADCLRNMLIELQNYKSSSELTQFNVYKNQIYNRLCEIVDDFSHDTGLNNYADQALSYVKNQNNVSDKWECGLTAENIEHAIGTGMSTTTEKIVDLSCWEENGKSFEQIVREEMANDTQSAAQSLVKHNIRSIDNAHEAMQPNLVQRPKLTSHTYKHNGNVDENHAIGIKSNGVTMNRQHIDRINHNSGKNQKLNGNRIQDELEPTQFEFKTAKDQFLINNKKDRLQHNDNKPTGLSSSSYGSNKKFLGSRGGTSQKFVPPVPRSEKDPESELVKQISNGEKSENEIEDERLKNICPKMIELVKNEIMDLGPPVHWDDIAGLEFAKNTIKEIVVWPMLRPDLFTGLRGPPKGLLLFGPPGTGKTLIGKCVASQSKATFFNISASSLTSKWIGDGEKMVRALFAVARTHLPAVIFIDEIDSILTQRSDTEHESSRRLKTEFLVQLDGATTCSDEQLLIIGATNRPQELDEAARRRLVKRLYIPLPESCARMQIVQKLMKSQVHSISDDDLNKICEMTEGYSGADMTNLCKEASLGPIRSLSTHDIQTVTLSDVRAINLGDFEHASKQVRASVSQKDLNLYLEWNESFGSAGNK